MTHSVQFDWSIVFSMQKKLVQVSGTGQILEYVSPLPLQLMFKNLVSENCASFLHQKQNRAIEFGPEVESCHYNVFIA